MRICFVVDEFPVLSQTFVTSQVLGLRQRGFDVAVASDKLFAALDDPAIELMDRWRDPALIQGALERLPIKLKATIQLFADLASPVRLDDYDVLVAHFGGNGRRLARLKALGKLKTPFVTVFHGYDVALPAHQGKLGRYRGLFAQGDLLLPVSDHFRRILVEAGAPPARTKVHRMGVDCAAIPFSPRARGDGPVRFLSVARLVEKKGIAYAVAAFAALQARRPDLDWRFEVIGDGPLLNDLAAQAAASGLGERISFLGAQPHAEVARRLADAHAFVLPSVQAANGDQEGVPVALMEAMAAGLVVVSSHHSGIPELIDHEVGGLLAAERDVEGLSRCLEQVIDDPAACEAMAKAARAKVEADFSRARLDDALAEMLRDLAAR